jgi:hypothetical protein
MSSLAWQLIAENRIQEALERGEFDDLPGSGRPLDLSDYFGTPVRDRMAFSLLRSAGVLPPELELLKEAETLERALATCSDERRRSRMQQQIQARRTAFSMALEHRARSARVDGGLEPPLV